jgi:hypothetical protein
MDRTQTHGPVRVLLSPQIKNLFRDAFADIERMLPWISTDEDRVRFAAHLEHIKSAVKRLESEVSLPPAANTRDRQRGTRNDGWSPKSSRHPQQQAGR